MGSEANRQAGQTCKGSLLTNTLSPVAFSSLLSYLFSCAWRSSLDALALPPFLVFFLVIKLNQMTVWTLVGLKRNSCLLGNNSALSAVSLFSGRRNDRQELRFVHWRGIWTFWAGFYGCHRTALRSLCGLRFTYSEKLTRTILPAILRSPVWAINQYLNVRKCVSHFSLWNYCSYQTL